MEISESKRNVRFRSCKSISLSRSLSYSLVTQNMFGMNQVSKQ